MVEIGLLTVASLAARAARRYGPGDDGPLRDVVPWALIGGLLGAHLMHVLAYHPELLREQGFWVLFKFWDGISSMGGVIGALAGIGLFFHRRRLRLRPYLDALALGTAPGWAIARIGCFLVHDHPGVRTNLPLAVGFPGGGRRDPCLYDFLGLGGFCATLCSVALRRPPLCTLPPILAFGHSLP